MTRAVKMTGVCPHCGEPIDVVFTKKELKQILKWMKLSLRAADIASEQYILKRMKLEKTQ